jgi:hypothetical protein
MRKFITIAAALAAGAAWTLAPAFAAETTAEKAERKAEQAADRAERAADRVEDKASSTKETLKERAVDTKEKIKEKFARAKDKMRAKTEGDGRVDMMDTRAAQEALKTRGFDPGPIDGLMGPRTRAAVMDYQKKNDLPPTGMLDTATMAKLDVRSSRSTDVPAASPATQPDPKKQNP